MNKTLAFLLCLAIVALVVDMMTRSLREGMSDEPQGTNGEQNTQNTSDTQGVPTDQIPPGDEDLYILKSEIVPPVCPACPSVTVCPDVKHQKCQPCPPCGRCPEPAFECKKVPNYNSQDNAMLPGFYANANIAGASAPIGGDAQSSQPMPVLNDFSQFGM